MRKPRRKFRTLATSFAWLAGVFLLIGAVAGPLYFNFVHLSGFRADMETAVGRLAAAQRDELVVRERFRTFDNRIPQPPGFANAAAIPADLYRDRRMVLAGWERENGNFMIRAMTRPDAVRSDLLPAILLEQEIDPQGKTVKRTWVDE